MSNLSPERQEFLYHELFNAWKNEMSISHLTKVSNRECFLDDVKVLINSIKEQWLKEKNVIAKTIYQKTMDNLLFMIRDFFDLRAEKIKCMARKHEPIEEEYLIPIEINFAQSLIRAYSGYSKTKHLFLDELDYHQLSQYYPHRAASQIRDSMKDQLHYSNSLKEPYSESYQNAHLQTFEDSYENQYENSFNEPNTYNLNIDNSISIKDSVKDGNAFTTENTASDIIKDITSVMDVDMDVDPTSIQDPFSSHNSVSAVPPFGSDVEINPLNSSIPPFGLNNENNINLKHSNNILSKNNSQLNVDSSISDFDYVDDLDKELADLEKEINDELGLPLDIDEIVAQVDNNNNNIPINYKKIEEKRELAKNISINSSHNQLDEQKQKTHTQNRDSEKIYIKKKNLNKKYSNNESEKIHSSVPIEYFTLITKVPIPAIVGDDLEVYGPFDTGEIVSIPKRNAQVLLEEKMVELIKSDKTKNEVNS